MKANVQRLIYKANTLVEALPYIQKFNRKIIVVKYGGAAMLDDTLKEKVIQDVTLLKLVGFKPILVHGGGHELSAWIKKLGKIPEFVNGLRVTDKPTIELVDMVFGRINKSLVQLVESLGVRAIGISGSDGKLLTVKKKKPDGEDLGFIGEIHNVDTEILYDLLEKDFLPIIYPVGLDKDYQTYNINADDVACAIAKAIHAEKLAYLTDVDGVFMNPKDKDSFIHRINTSRAKKLIKDGIITGGMIPKLKNCIDAVENGVDRVHILNGTIPHCLLLEIFTNAGIGTLIFDKPIEY
ncbi:MAG: acetylglutamate kinase [Eggerthellaceae bacterium]|nr:acetylglutamate kinase [Eggerthellaceae bacterium]